MSIIFKTFRTYAHPYVYDRHTNAVVMLTEDEYKELVDVEKGKMVEEDSAVLKKYQKEGLFHPNTVQHIEHPGTDIIEQYLKTRLKQLTLQVTQQCNLRCAYCAYSGIYNNSRTHANAVMSFDVAKKAIDFFLERNNELSKVVIGFYGGEPLLEFDLIKHCVEYSKSKVEGKEIRFNMTTNGTLLTDKVVDFLVENDFTLAISLDGSKEEHDVNRKFINGQGSFDIIMKNIKRLKERYPKYGEEIMFLTTINPYMDVGCTLEYFKMSDVFNDRQIIFNTMKEVSLSNSISYDKKYFMIRNLERIKLLFWLIGKLEKKYVSPLMIRSKESIEKKAVSFREHIVLPEMAHHGGPCMPGVHRLFVRVDGTLFPCEKVSEGLDYFKIGTLDHGFDIVNIKRMLNIGQVTESNCKTCWNLRQCSLCSAQIDFDSILTKDRKLTECSKCVNNVLFELYELCVLKEFGYDEEEMRID